MVDLKLIEEAIKIDAKKFIENIKKIKDLKYLDDENDFQKARKLWFESENLLKKIRKLDYSDHKSLELAKKKLVQVLEDVKKEINKL